MFWNCYVVLCGLILYESAITEQLSYAEIVYLEIA